MFRLPGEPEREILTVQGNLANSYTVLGREQEASRMARDVYSGRVKLDGKDHKDTFRAAYNYTLTLDRLGLEQGLEEARKLLRKTIPTARSVLGDNNSLTLKLRSLYADVLRKDGATLDDLREAVTTLEDTERTARRVLGGAHPLVVDIGDEYRDAQAAFCARETLRPSPDAGRPSYNIPPWTMPLDDDYFI